MSKVNSSSARMTIVTLTLSWLMVILMVAVTSAEPVNVTVWGSNDYRVVGLEAAAQAFNAQSEHVQIEVVLDGGAPDRIITAVAGGAAPDIIVGAHSWDPDFIINGLLVNLSPLLERDGLLDALRADVFPGLWDAGSVWNGNIYSIPLDAQAIMLYYNEHLLQESGVAAPAAGWVWPELEESLPKIRRQMGSEISTHALVANHQSHVGTFFLSQNHATLFDTATLKPTANTAEFRAAYGSMSDLTQRDLMRSGGVELSGGESVNMFAQGDVGFYISGNFRLPAFEGDETAREFTKVAPALRWAPGMEPRYYGSTRTLALIRPDGGGPVSDEVWEAFKYLISTEAMSIYGAEAGLLTTRRSVIEQPRYGEYIAQSEATRVIASEIIPFSAGGGITGVPYTSEIQGAFQRLTVQYLRGEIGLTQVVEQFSTEAGVFLDEIRGMTSR